MYTESIIAFNHIGKKSVRKEDDQNTMFCFRTDANIFFFRFQKKLEMILKDISFFILHYNAI